MGPPTPPFGTRPMSAGHPPLLRSQDLSGIRNDPFRDRLAEVASDRAAPARRIVQETSGILRRWLLELPDEHPLDGGGLEAELATWIEEQAWRGPCALWLDSLRAAWHASADRGETRSALALEASAWCADEDAGPGVARRLPSRAALAERAAADLGRGETVLVTAWSETVALALEAAWRLGKRPEVLLGEGSPGLDGRRMARRLVRAGIPVTMAYDAALPALVPRADRLWLSSEAIGAGELLARVGTRDLLEECARRDVPARVLATSDKLMPGGGLRLPAWSERETWLLWEDAPEGVRLESQCFEAVPLELAGNFLTEIGPEAAPALHLRALRVETAQPCGAPAMARSAHTP